MPKHSEVGSDRQNPDINQDASREILSQWLEIHAQEVNFQKERMDIDRYALEQNHELARRSLDLRFADLGHERAHQLQLAKLVAFSGVSVLLILAVFSGVMALMDKEVVLEKLMSFLTEVAKVFFGGVVGYCIALVRQRGKGSADDENIN